MPAEAHDPALLFGVYTDGTSGDVAEAFLRFHERARALLRRLGDDIDLDFGHYVIRSHPEDPVGVSPLLALHGVTVAKRWGHSLLTSDRALSRISLVEAKDGTRHTMLELLLLHPGGPGVQRNRLGPPVWAVDAGHDLASVLLYSDAEYQTVVEFGRTTP